MSRVPTLPAIGLAIVAAVALVATLVLPASAGRSSLEYLPEFGSGDEAVNFRIMTYDVACETVSYGVEREDGPVELAEGDLTPVVQDVPDQDFDYVTVTIENLPTGEYRLVRSCDPGQEQEIGVEYFYFTFSRIVLTKDVAFAPEDASFDMDIACTYPEPEFPLDQAAVAEPMLNTWTRTFGNDGGTTNIVVYPRLQDRLFRDIAASPVCTVTETETSGAETVTFKPTPPADFTPESADPATQFALSSLGEEGFTDVPVTVTNTFPEPEPEPTPTPTPTPEPEPTSDDVASDVLEAEPAQPVETEPDFTG